MSGPTFTAGHDIKGAFATGDHSTATAALTETVAPDPTIDIAAALTSLREILSGVPGIETKTLTRLDEAQEEAAKPMSKPEEVRSLVEQATKYAKQAAGFAEAAGKLTPLLKQVAAWCGTAWNTWAPALGLQ